MESDPYYSAWHKDAWLNPPRRFKITVAASLQGERNEPKCFQNSVCPRAFRPLTPALPFQLPDAADTRQIFVKLGEKEPYLVIFHLSYLPSHCPQSCPQSNQSAHFPNTAQEPLRTLDPGFSVSGPQFTQLKIGGGSPALILLFLVVLGLK